MNESCQFASQKHDAFQSDFLKKSERERRKEKLAWAANSLHLHNTSLFFNFSFIDLSLLFSFYYGNEFSPFFRRFSFKCAITFVVGDAKV